METKDQQTGQKEFLAALGQRIRDARLKKDFTQEEVCFAASMSQHYLSQVESGHRNITVGALRRIAGVLGVSVAELLAGLE